MSSTISVSLSPTPGFCIKTKASQTGTYKPRHTAAPADNALLEPKSSTSIPIPKGLKIFINIAWDKNVPPPPEGSEEAIQQAMQGKDRDELNPDEWFVPVIVSDGRQDKDKAGNSALVFSCIFNPSLKSRALKDLEFKIFLIELAIQRIEAQPGLSLSWDDIGTPNISSKGKIAPFDASLPAALFPGHEQPDSSASTKGKGRLIEELPPSGEIPPPDVKDASSKGKGKLIEEVDLPPAGGPSLSADAGDAKDTLGAPEWTWVQDGPHIRLTVAVPQLTREVIPRTTLDLGPRRILLHVPEQCLLDLDLSLSETALGKEQAVALKRARALDVDAAWAEWRVAERCIVIQA
ncbi:hypothetical protein EWM64_g5732 [Hericium alpestre]|uniref:PIH1 N-terminal domain-containing protein n=1 Tax=Hericium alpestre TaxID=135208 RepID=A0A4Y9ZVT3_9AGAM|nr:hypothetical protein EWM64_g5732 [Hericium alpestre]